MTTILGGLRRMREIPVRNLTKVLVPAVMHAMQLELRDGITRDRLAGVEVRALLEASLDKKRLKRNVRMNCLDRAIAVWAAYDLDMAYFVGYPQGSSQLRALVSYRHDALATTVNGRALLTFVGPIQYIW